MQVSMQVIESKLKFPQLTRRRTIQEEAEAASYGSPPRQATSDSVELFADAQLISPQAFAATKAIAALLKARPQMGREKNWFRLLAKTASKSIENQSQTQDPGFNCDISRSRVWLKNKAQAREAINMFPESGVYQLKDGLIVSIREVENNLSSFNHRKAGLPNLDLKMTFYFKSHEGLPSFHHHELHMLFMNAAQDYENSHKAYQRKRLAQTYRDGADKALASCDESDAVSWGKKWAQYNREVEEAHATRFNCHNKIRDNLGLDELDGYKPCTTSKAKKLANYGEMLYVIS